MEGFADIAAPCLSCQKIKSNSSSPTKVNEHLESCFMFQSDSEHNNGFGTVFSRTRWSRKVNELFSKVLTKSERNYCVTKKELLAIINDVDHFHKYLYRIEFLIRIDLAALNTPERQMTRWIAILNQYHFKFD